MLSTAHCDRNKPEQDVQLHHDLLHHKTPWPVYNRTQHICDI